MRYLIPLDITCKYCGRKNGSFGHLMEFKDGWFCNASICFDGWLFDQRGYGLFYESSDGNGSPLERFDVLRRLEEITERYKEKNEV